MKKILTTQILAAVLSLVFCVSVLAAVPFDPEADYSAYKADGTRVSEADFILDPGHGGSDPGALGPADENGVVREEADDNLAFALNIGAILESKGYTVAFTRITDEKVELADRSNIANAGHYTIYCSLHRNSFSKNTAKGVEVYYHKDLSADSEPAKIANTVLNNILKTPGGITNRGVKTAGYSVLNNTATNAILVETLFISNPNDNAIFDNYRTELATNVANGLIEALQYSTPDYLLDNKYLPADLGYSFFGTITQTSTGLALTNTGASDIVASENIRSDAQVFLFEKTTTRNEYKLTNALDGRCLDIASAGTTNGTNVMIWDSNDLDCQRFYFYDVDGAYYIKPVHCTTDMVFDVDAATNNVQIYEFGEGKSQQRFNVNVITEDVALELTEESTYTLESAIVSGVKNETAVADFAANFKNEGVKVVNAESVEITGFVGTGCVVSASDTEETAVIVVIGDNDGDGELSSTDYLKIKSYFLGMLELDGVYFTASDVDNSGTIDSTDYMALKSHFLGIIDIYA